MTMTAKVKRYRTRAAEPSKGGSEEQASLDEEDVQDAEQMTQPESPWKWAYVVVILAFAVAFSAYMSSRYLGIPKPSYTSFIDIRIIPTGAELSYARSAIGGNRDAQSSALVQTFAETLTSDRVITAALEQVRAVAGDDAASPVAQKDMGAAERFKGYISRLVDRLNYGRDITGTADELQRLRRAIVVDNIKGSFVVRVSVRMKDPERAAYFASALVEAYTVILNEENSEAQDRIRASYRTRLEAMDAELSTIIEEELELRETLGAVDLEARVQSLNRSIDDISTMIIPLRIQLERISNVDPDDVGLRSLQQQVAALETRMEGMIAERRLLTSLEFELRANWKRQDSIAAAITEVRNSLYSPALDREHGIVNINVLRMPKVSDVPDPPTPLQLAAIAWFGTLVLAFCLAVAFALFRNVTRPYD